VSTGSHGGRSPSASGAGRAASASGAGRAGRGAVGESNDSAGGSRTLSRGLAVLQSLGHAPDGATVADLAGATQLDRAVLYRLLDTLTERGFVVRDPDTRRFHLGVALVELGARASRGLEVRRLALPGMRALMDQTREAVCLAVRDRGDIVVVDRVEPPGLFVRVGYHVGFRHALPVGAHGRALLAFLDGDERTKLSDRHPPLLAELEACRARGFAISADELERGASGVAAPILDRAGRPIAAVGVVAPSPRLPDPAALGPRIRGFALEVSRRLGYAPLEAR
jgi:DNA-binding IclR family transcriptional regulator